MTAFEERLARIGAEGGAVTASGANESDGSTANMSARKDTRDAADPNDQGGMGPFGVLLTLLALPLAMAIGAASVVAGGVVQVVFIDGGLTGSTPIPPNWARLHSGLRWWSRSLQTASSGSVISAPSRSASDSSVRCSAKDDWPRCIRSYG